MQEWQKLMKWTFLILLSGTCLAQAHYQQSGPALLQDHMSTPGVVRTKDKNVICNGGSTKQFRHTSQATKDKVYKMYGATKRAGVCCEVDHLIPLELGGADDIKNLWPQPYKPTPGAHQKDLLENKLHIMICSGELTPEQAQFEISNDWYAAYLKFILHSKIVVPTVGQGVNLDQLTKERPLLNIY